MLWHYYLFGVTDKSAHASSSIWAMKVATGTVIDGKIIVEGESLANGVVAFVALCSPAGRSLWVAQ